MNSNLRTSQPRRRRRSAYTEDRPVDYRTITTVVLGFVLAGILGAATYFYPVLTALTQTGQSVNTDAAASDAVPSGAPFTVLLLGSDDDSKFPGERFNTQSMILVRVVPGSRRVTMMSIPRDLWVPRSANSDVYEKISIAYSNGGAQAAVETVQRNFGVKVDEYVWIGLGGLQKLVDALGGVDLVTTNPVLDDFYPADIGVPNPYSYARIAVLPGPQHLDGVHALEYARSRHGDLRSDFARSARQQQILVALRSKARFVNASDLPRLAATFAGEMKTSLTVGRVLPLLKVAQQITPDAIDQVVLAPPYTNLTTASDGESILEPDWSLIRPLVATKFPPR